MSLQAVDQQSHPCKQAIRGRQFSRGTSCKTSKKKKEKKKEDKKDNEKKKKEENRKHQNEQTYLSRIRKSRIQISSTLSRNRDRQKKEAKRKG